MSLRIGGVVLAAGASTRAGCSKALATVDGESLVHRGARVLREGGAQEVVVVVGPPHGDRIAEALEASWSPRLGEAARILENGDPTRGMLSSLKIALTHGDDAGWHAAVVILVDQPHVRAADVAALGAAFAAKSPSIVRVAAGDRRGHPYLVARSVFADIIDADDELGPRPVLRAIEDALTVHVDDPRVLDDVDTPTDLAEAGVKPPA